MSAQKITFIGAGNMASALLRGLLASGVSAAQLCASDPVASRLAELAKTGISTTDSNDTAVAGADVVVIAVKPQVLGAVLTGLTTLQPGQLLMSVAAGVPLASLAAWSCTAQPIIRCMPNTPVLVGAGMTALCANPTVSSAQRALAEKIMGAAGKTLWVADEGALDAVTAVSGSGPAYYFYLMEAMVEAGVELGLDRAAATELTLETAYGAALMARGSATTPAQLRENVTSPGGTTAAALSVFDAADTHQIIKNALSGAADRSRELAKEFGAP